MLLLGETLPIALTGAAVVEGTMLLGTGIAYIHEQLSPQEGTLDVRPVQVPQGMVMGSGTDYVVTVSNGSTTIQVMAGSVIFVDQYTNNTITVGANQMLTLPSGITTGFTTQDLASQNVSIRCFIDKSVVDNYPDCYTDDTYSYSCSSNQYCCPNKRISQRQYKLPF